MPPPPPPPPPAAARGGAASTSARGKRAASRSPGTREAEQLCAVCYDPAPASGAAQLGFLACAENHVTCSHCVSELCRQSAPDGILRCPYAPRECAAPPYALSAVLRTVGDAAFDRLMTRRIDAAVSEGRAAAAVEASANAIATDADNAAAHIRGRILTAHCPRCDAAFLDFDGCLALKCASPGCGAHFCGWCLDYFFDRSEDAHRHVAVCPKRHPDAKDPHFANKALYDAVRRKAEAKALAVYLDKLDERVKTQALKQANLEAELRERGHGEVLDGTAIVEFRRQDELMEMVRATIVGHRVDLERVVELLQDGNDELRALGVRALHDIACGDDDERRDAVVLAGAIAPLVASVRDGTANVKQQAAETLSVLCRGKDHVNVRDEILARGGTEPLVALLRDGDPVGKASAALAIAEIIQGGNVDRCNQFAEAGFVPPLVALLRDGDEDGQIEAAGAIAELCSSGMVAHSTAVVEAGCIVPLVDMMRNVVDPDVSVSAAGALAEIAWRRNPDEPAHCSAIVDANGIEALVGLLSGAHVGGNHRTHAEAAWAVAAIASSGDEEHRARIVDANAIPKLISIVQHGQSDGQFKAARALAELARPKYAADICACGAIGPLVMMLDTGEKTIKAQAAGTLAALASGADATQRKAIYDAGAATPLFKLLGNGDDSGKAQAVWALKEMVHDGNSTWAKAIVHKDSGVLELLVDMLKNGEDRVKQHAAVTLAQTASSATDAHREAVRKAGTIKPLVTLLREGEETTKAQAVWALGVLARTGQRNCCNEIIQHGALTNIVHVLEHGSDSRKAAAATVLAEIASTNYLPHVQKILAEGCIGPLLELLRHGHQMNFQLQAGWALREILKVSTNSKAELDEVVRAGIIPALVSKLRVSTDDSVKCVAVEAAWALAELGKHTQDPSHRAAIVEAGAPARLVEMIKAADDGVEEGDEADGWQQSQSYALWVLEVLTRGAGPGPNQRNRDAIVAAGAIPPLVEILRKDSNSSKSRAVAALASLACDGQEYEYTRSNKLPEPNQAVLQSLVDSGAESVLRRLQGHIGSSGAVVLLQLLSARPRKRRRG